MRSTMIFTVLGTVGLLAATGCGAVQKAEKEVTGNPTLMKGAEDGSMTVAAKAELGKNGKAKGHGFDVSVKGGVATLTGTGPADAKAAAEAAVKVPGVTKVQNNITVK